MTTLRKPAWATKMDEEDGAIRWSHAAGDDPFEVEAYIYDKVTLDGDVVTLQRDPLRVMIADQDFTPAEARRVAEAILAVVNAVEASQ